MVLLYLILVAQFRSFKDPFLIMLAIPMGFIGVMVILPLTHTTLNVMSLMGVLMLVGIAASNSILIVEFAHRLEEQQMSVEDAVITSCRVRLRPDPDDFARHHHRDGADGPEDGHGQRAVRAAGPGHHRRAHRVGPPDGLHRSGGLYAGLPARRAGGKGLAGHAALLHSQSVLHHRGLPGAGGHRRHQPVVRMPVDLFPAINLPEVVVATFYSGMPPEDIETDITDPLERFFTLASGIDHMESRSLLGVSIIKVFFQPGTNADADVTELSNLALADLKRLPPGTLPPVVLKFDASSLPVCLVTVKGEGLNETQLHDLAQFQIRNQIAVVKGAEIPPPFGGKYRQVMVYVDPYKLLSRQLSVMDVVRCRQPEQPDSARPATSRSAPTTTTSTPTAWSSRSRS